MKTKKILVLALAALLLVAVSVGGTIAYLTSTPDAVVNTFTAADIQITLSETANDDDDIDNDNNRNEWVAQLIPGKKYAKDPSVQVDDVTTIPIFVYFKVVDGAAAYINYNLNTDGWTLVDETNYPGVYYREWKPGDPAGPWYLLQGEGEAELKNGFVTIKPSLTQTQTSTVVADSVKLTFEAYAIQQEGFTAKTGWEELIP